MMAISGKAAFLLAAVGFVYMGTFVDQGLCDDEDEHRIWQIGGHASTPHTSSEAHHDLFFPKLPFFGDDDDNNPLSHLPSIPGLPAIPHVPAVPPVLPVPPVTDTPTTPTPTTTETPTTKAAPDTTATPTPTPTITPTPTTSTTPVTTPTATPPTPPTTSCTPPPATPPSISDLFPEALQTLLLIILGAIGCNLAGIP